MKRILFLDDDRKRIDEFRERAAGMNLEVTIVETAADCIASLSQRSFDLVLLDHDLGGETFCDSDREDCGMEVVRWLKANRGDHGAFIVHTMNAVAAATMYFELIGLEYPTAQAQFGSPEFYANFYAMAGGRPQRKTQSKQSRSLGEKFSEYFRSLKLRR
jgi:CheY-like chemotaxis protein